MTPEALAAAMAAGETPSLLDTRDPDAFARAHLPGSALLPAAELPRRYGELDRLAGPWVVIPPGEDPEAPGRLLREVGFERVSTLEGGLSRWTGRVDHGPPPGEEEPAGAPGVSAVVVAALASMRPWGRVLLLGCGPGHDAVHLAAQDLEVVAVDGDAACLNEAARRAEDAGVRLQTIHAGPHGNPPGWPAAPETFDGVVLVGPVWRPGIPRVVGAVRPGGLVALEAPCAGAPGRPGVADHPRRETVPLGGSPDEEEALRRGEVDELFPGWKPLVHREGPTGAEEARILWVARKPMRVPE